MRTSKSKNITTLKPKRRWFQFSLGTMFLIMTVTAIWLGRTTDRARRQARAVKAVEETHGLIQFDYQVDKSGKARQNPQPPAPEWLRKAVGEEYFRKVVTVDFAVGAGLRRKGPVSNATDDDLRHLESLTDIETLELGNNFDVTDTGLVHLRGLKQLKTLYLYRTSVSGPGLIHLARLPELESLHLGRTPLQDEGLKHIAKMHRLKWLHLENTQVTNDGLACLAKLQKLETLSLANTDVTDAGLRHLEGLAKLQLLSLGGTNISAAGANRVRQALPNCRVLVTYGLGQTPRNVRLWPDDHQPTREELLAKLTELGIDVQTDKTRPGNPVVSFTVFDSTLSDDVVVQLLDDLPHLEQINLRRVLVGDDLLKAIKNRTQLTYLSLQSSRITDSGLQHLPTLPNLEELILTETRITDAALPHLRTLRSLSFLSVEGTRVTNDGVHHLKQALPSCTMSF